LLIVNGVQVTLYYVNTYIVLRIDTILIYLSNDCY